MKIDPRAAIAPGAQLGAEVEVGPFAIIDENVIVGDGCKIGPHVHLTGHTTISANTKIRAGAVIGDAPQTSTTTAADHYTDIGGTRCANM